MKIIKLLGVFIFGVVIGYFITYKVDKIKEDNKYDLIVYDKIDDNTPPSLCLYYWMNYYSDSLDIPINYIYGVASSESSWQGPLDLRYKPNLKSCSGALGPMQIMPSTARIILGKSVTNDILRNDIRLNVMISAKLLKDLYIEHGDWKTAFGAYNTGRPLINGYSRRVFDYKPDWKESVDVNL